MVRASSAAQARLAAQAVCEGGIPIVEITMTVPGAIEVIRDLRKNASGVLIGAGTVLNVETAQRCLDVAAEFLVKPRAGYSHRRVRRSRRHAHAGRRSDPHRSHHRLERRLGPGQDFPLRSSRRSQVHQSFEGAAPQVPMVPRAASI